ncbi:MAG TPA: phage tail sheath subtilisin-like domain-containing protein [bacterium]|nr:phage tail sheath subtilisin-like domain-containing protein [bacterium]
MPANFLHGVETIEIEKGPRPIRGVKTAVIGLVGTAPMLDVDPADRTLNRIRLVTNDRDAERYFGQNRAGFTIPRALDAIFDQGNGPICVVVNVLDPATDTTAVTDEAKTFDAATDRAQLAHPQVSNVVVKHTSGTPVYVLNTDYTLDAANGTITRKAGGAIASGQSVKVSYSWLDPSKALNADIIGTVDGAGNRTGMQALLNAYQELGFFPKILIAPGYSTANAVATELNVLAGKLRAIALVDAPVGTTVQQAITGRGPSGAINFNYSSDRMVLCYPHLKVYDGATDSEILEPFSPRLAGRIAATDQERGYWWSASNQEIKGIVGVELPLTAMINDPTTETNLLNEAGIVTVFNAFGSGLRTWGNRSAAWPSNTHPRNFINIRRTADVIHESIEYSMLQFLDQPITDALIDAITESVNLFLRTLVMRGALIDGKCWWDKAKNPVTEIALGHLTFDITFMPPPPLERVTFESFIDINLLSQLGGNR